MLTMEMDQSRTGGTDADGISADSGVCCVPGDCLCVAGDKYQAGSGTYERTGYIRASRAGRVYRRGAVVEVRLSRDDRLDQGAVPTPGCVVTCRVLSVNPRQCRCDILCVGATLLQHSHRALLKREDVRATQRDLVKMYECFRPGDLLLARVLSLGDALAYQLTTAEPELGVARARSETGAWMVPTSWTEMTCPQTQARELRKVAKIPPEDVARRIAAMKLASS